MALAIIGSGLMGFWAAARGGGDSLSSNDLERELSDLQAYAAEGAFLAQELHLQGAASRYGATHADYLRQKVEDSLEVLEKTSAPEMEARRTACREAAITLVEQYERLKSQATSGAVPDPASFEFQSIKSDLSKL